MKKWMFKILMFFVLVISNVATVEAQNTLTALGVTNGATVAYSVRQLSSSYTGPLMRIRNNTNNNLYDVWPDASGQFSTTSVISTANPSGTPGSKNGSTALSTITSSTTFTVAIWYDQSGNARNLTQTTNANQPTIISSGTIQTEGSKPFIRFYGTLNSSTDFNSLVLATALTTNGHVSVVNKFASGGDGFLLGHSNSSSYNWHSDNVNSELFDSYASSSVKNGNVWQNGTSVTATNAVWNTSLGINTIQPQTANSGTTWDNIGRDRTYHHTSGGGGYAELIVFASALSTKERQSIESSQGSYSGITVPAASAPTSISGTSTICNGSSTTLTSTGGNYGFNVEDIWYRGGYGGDAYDNGLDATTAISEPSSQSTTNNNTYGILNLRSTGTDPYFYMRSLGSFNPSTYKYVNVRYRVTAGTGGNMQIFFLNTTYPTYADGSATVYSPTLNSDGNWHTVSIDMSSSAAWTTGGNITGWRFDWSNNSGVTMDIDFIQLGTGVILDDASSITVSPTTSTTYYLNRKGSSVNTSSISQLVTVRSAFTSGAISTTGQTICSGGTLTVIGSATASSGGDGTITYSWRSSADSYASAISGATSATYTPPAGLTSTTSYRRYANDGTCTTTPTVSTGTWTVTVSAAPTPTFTAQPGATACASTDVTYTTQASQTNYIWTVPGTLNTDYTITSGGVGSSSNTVTLKWLTAGSKTVTINYTNSNGCTAATATSSTATTVSAPTLGTYSTTTVIAGQSTSITPSVAPTNCTSIVAYSTTNFTGTLTVNPTTGVVSVTNAKQAGTYLVTVQAFSSAGCTSTATFTLTVSNPNCSLGNFGGTTEVSVGTEQNGVAIGDFNGDGKQDIATANVISNTVSIRLGDGAGGFSGSTEVSVGTNPESLAIGDFNGDGKQDFAAANRGSSTVSIRLGDGTGGFSGTTNVSVGSGPVSVEIGDFNGDGKQDIAAANYFSATVSIRLGDGAGGFSGSTNVGVGSGPRLLAIGDFNGDGKQDIAVPNGTTNTVSIRLGDGAGGFSGTTVVSVGTNPFSVAIGDFNGDGMQDIAAANRGSATVSIRLGDGAGGFSGSTTVSVQNRPVSLAIGDFNGDGKQDIATANDYAATVSIRLGDGTGGFSGSTNVDVGTNPQSVAIGDFNGDGMQDIATANYGRTTVSIRLGGSATFTAQPGTTACASTDVTYTTQSGQTNYVWTVPGTLNTDYTITSGGLGTTSNTVTLKWLTVGSKTVTINYTSSSCSAGTATSSTATTVSARPTPTFTAQPGATACESTDVTYTTQSGQTNYVWTVPGTLNTNYSITSGGVGTTSNTVTLKWLTTGSKTVTINYTSNGCTAATATSSTATTVTASARPTPTFTVQPGATACASTDVTYTTQSGQTNYVWSVPGTLGTDYTITSGGVSTTSNTVTLKWLTAGSKTVTINYANSCNLTAETATSSTATTVSAAPTPTFTAQPGATACASTDVTYTTQASQTNYIWTVPGTLNTDYTITSGGVGSSSNTVTLKWLTAGSKTVTINYTNSNGCTAATATSSTATTVSAPTLGTYSSTTVIAGQNATITPTAAPTNSTSIVAYSTTNFTGTLTVNPTTGVVSVTNAKQAGTYLVTLKAFSSASCTSTATFTLTVSNPNCSIGNFGGTTTVSAGVGGGGRSVAIGDFNGDGKHDIAAANEALASVSIHLGDGTGGFSGNTAVSVGTSPYSVAIGDFNGDGKQDIATANYGSANVSIRLGDGAGGFSGSTNVSVGTNPRSVAIGDFNGDGKQDIAAANGGSATVSIRLGDGSGGFSGSTNVGVGSNPSSVAIGDFNGDGKQDIAAANEVEVSGTVSIRLGDGAGGFSGSTNISVGSFPYSVAIGDFNGDGKQDIAAPNRGSATVSIRLGDGTGDFSGSTNFGAASSPMSVAIGDFNGDGKQDIASANHNVGYVSIHLGDGAGGFSGTTGLFYADGNVASVAIGDFNGDGMQDFATANRNPLTSIRLGGSATFTAQPGATACASTDVTYTTQSGQTNYVWTVPGTLNTDYTITSGGVGTTSNTVRLKWLTAGSKTVSINYTSSGCTPATATSSTATTVSARPTPTFTAQPGATACPNTDVTYTTQSGQTNYVWTVPGTLNTNYSITSGGVGTTSNTVTLKWLTAGSKTVTINYTSNGCTAATATSSTATTVSAIPTPTFTAQPGATACASTDVTYTTQSGQTNYAWTVPGTENTDYTITSGGVGTTSNTVTLKWLTAGSKTVTINYANSCNLTAVAATSSTATTVSETPVIASQSTATQTVCQNSTAANFSVTATGSGTISYQWYSNTSASNSGGASLGSANGAQTATYTPQTSATGTKYYYCIVTIGSCTATSAVSGAVVVTPLSIAGSISGAGGTCYGTAKTLTLSGNTGTIQWQVSTTSISTGFSDISGETASTYVVPTTTATGTYYYQAVVTNGVCSPATTASVTVTVNALPVISSQSTATQTVCQNATATAFSVSATGTSLTYQWYSNTSASNSGGTIIASATSSSYTPSTTIAGTLYYYCVVTNGSSCTATSAVSGAVIVNAVPVVAGVAQGVNGNGLKFDGSNDYVISDVSGTAVTSFTMESYIKFTTNETKGILQWANGLTHGTPFIYWMQSGLNLRIYANYGYRITTTLSLDTWYHVALVYSSNVYTLYINGSSVGTYSGGFTFQSNATNFYLGNGYHGYFGGVLDEVRIWNTARTQSQIQATMNTELAGTETGLMAYYNFNHGTAGGTNTGITTLTDRTSNAKNGTLYNFALTGSTSNWSNGANNSTSGSSAAETVCLNSTIQLSNTTTGGTWSTSDANIATVDNTGLVTGIAVGSVTISYTVTNASNCSTTATTPVTVNALPVITGQSTAAQRVIQNGTASAFSVTATGTSLTYQWYSNTTASNAGGTSIASATSSTYTPLTTTVGTTYYYCIVTNANGCIATSAVSGAVVIEQMYITSTGTIGTVCYSSSAQTSTLAYTATANNPTSYSIDWNAAANTAGLADQTSTNYTFASGSGTIPDIAISAGAAAGTYSGTLTIRNTNNITATLAVTITINPLPTITTAGIATAKCFSTSAQTTSLAYSATTQSPISYSIDWNAAANTAGLTDQATTSYSFVAGGGTLSSIAIPASIPGGTYTGTMTITMANGCANTQAISYTSYALPIAGIRNNTSTTVLTSTVTSISLTATGGSTYSWSDGSSVVSTTAAYRVTAPGTYTVTVTNANGCSATASITITQTSTPPASSITNNTGTTELNCTTSSISLTATGGGTYSWSNGTSVVGTSAGLTVTAPGTYTVTVTNGGSTSTSSITITQNVVTSATAVLTGSTTITSGKSANLQATISIGNAPYTVVISDGTTQFTTYSYYSGPNIVVTPSATKTYTLVSVTGANGCAVTGLSGSATVTVNGGGTSKVWTGAAGDNLWSTGGNWSPAGTPASNDFLTISSGTPQLDVYFTVTGSLTVNGTGTLTVNAGKSIDIGPEGVVDFGKRDITFKSSATGTAQLGKIEGTLSNADSLIVERYFPAGRRAYRFISASVTTPSSIRYNWMENATPVFTYTTIYTTLSAYNPKLSYGTHITGTDGNANGFDRTALNTSTLYTLNTTTQSWVGVGSTTGTLAAGDAYRILIRGDRGTNLNNNTAAASATTIRTKGAPKVGLHTVSSSLSTTADGWSLVGNPYQALVDLRGVSTTNLTPYYSIWDPQRGTRGAYVSYHLGTGIKSNVASDVNELVQPGQAFFVQTLNNGAATLTFDESNKAPLGTQTRVFRPMVSYPVLNVALNYTDSLANGAPEMDAFAVVFDNSFSNSVDKEDGMKNYNQDDNMGISRDGKLLAMELRDMYDASTVIPMNMVNYVRQNYTLRMNWSNPIDAGYEAYLKDNYTGATQTISFSSNTDYVFTVNSSIAASKATDRFSIMFLPSTALPVSGLELNGTAEGKQVKLQFTALNERDMAGYEIEHSTDGVRFTKIGDQPAVNGIASARSYAFIHNKPVEGNNYYRVKGTSLNGQEQYSNVKLIRLGAGLPTVMVAPNPAGKDKVVLKVSQLLKGNYTVTVTDALGRIFSQKEMVYDGLSGVMELKFPSIAKSGSYYVKVVGESGNFTEAFIIQ